MNSGYVGVSCMLVGFHIVCAATERLQHFINIYKFYHTMIHCFY